MEELSLTRARQAQKRRERIRSAAMELFWEKCVEDTSMEEIAKKAGVGPATVYRYFSTKIELVIETAQSYWETVAEKYMKNLEEWEKPAAEAERTGYAQTRQILHIFCQIFAKEKPFLKFLQEFDVFVKKYQISEERLKDYEGGILKLKPYLTAALEKGRKDKSLSFSCSVDEMYFTLTHTLLAFMEKMAAGGDILTSDAIVERQKQLEIIAELIMRGMKGSEKTVE